MLLFSTHVEGGRPAHGDGLRLSGIDTIQQQKMAEATRQSYAGRLRGPENALARLGRGEYGECQEDRESR
jgi:hypothetical protein